MIDCQNCDLKTTFGVLKQKSSLKLTMIIVLT